MSFDCFVMVILMRKWTELRKYLIGDRALSLWTKYCYTTFFVFHIRNHQIHFRVFLRFILFSVLVFYSFSFVLHWDVIINYVCGLIFNCFFIEAFFYNFYVFGNKELLLLSKLTKRCYFWVGKCVCVWVE